MQVFSDRIEAVIDPYEGSILPVAARAWAAMLARSHKHVDDTGLAATASVDGLVVVTRDVAHLRDRGMPLLDPFRSPAVLGDPAT